MALTPCLNFDVRGGGDDDFGAGALKFGSNAHDNRAIEVMAAAGFSDARIQGVKVDLSRAFGIYLKPKVNFGDAEVFGRLGYTDFRAKARAYGYSESDSDGGFSFGAGVSFSITEKVYAQVDYMRYYDRKGVELSGPSLSIGYKF